MDSHQAQSSDQLCPVVGENLRKLIARNKLTQKELAEKVGVTAASMTDYCKGRRLPTAEFSVALKKLYGILYIYETPSYLSIPHYSCAAILGIHERENASALKDRLEALHQPGKILEYIEREYANTAY